jgi:excinuclease UvrABC nuclease subunit
MSDQDPIIISRQYWLFPYENPLGTRLGKEFFSSIPRVPGIYKMFGPEKTLLYIGKAKDLRARLMSYRRAHPDQVSRKVLRMVHLITSIEWEGCETEEAALLRENELLRSLQPPFNVLNTHPESYFFLALSQPTPDRLKLRLTTDDHPLEGEELFGAFKSLGFVRKSYLATLRLLWAITHDLAENRFCFPGQLARYQAPAHYEIRFPKNFPFDARNECFSRLRSFLRGTRETLTPFLVEKLLEQPGIPPFLYRTIQDDIELLREFYLAIPRRNYRLRKQNGISKNHLIAQEELDDLIVRSRFTQSDK